ncbi:hypothetical protein [Pollutibacter soli]|uniref:hypothetical protein n=1 Tax=Pollutibacter soli TaxID=3034157 RepID=UPI0030136B0C
MIQCCTWFLAFLAISLQPPPKHWEAVAYNESTDELAVFSGAEFSHGKFYTTDSLWIFNQRWQYFDDNSISGRWSHALVWHKNDLYTYGGLTLNSKGAEVLLNDLYTFRKTWKKIGEGPLLNRPSLFSDAEKLILAGQSNLDQNVFEVWEISDNMFSKKMTIDIGFAPDGFALMNTKNGIVLSNFSSDGLIIRNLSNGETQEIKDQPKADKAAISYHPHQNCFFVFGGIKNNQVYSSDLYRIQDGHSKKISTSGPSPRAGAHLLPATKDLILYGGTNEKGMPTSEMWRLENDLWKKIVYP